MAKVKISRGLQVSYNAIPVKDGDTIYVCTDSGNIYVGELPVFEPNAYIDASLEGKVITFTTHGADGTNGTDSLDLSVFQTASEVAQAIAAAINGMAIDTNVVHKTGDETIAGVKTFTDSVKVNGNANIDFASATSSNVLLSHEITIENKEYDGDNDVGNTGVLQFKDLDKDGDIRLRGIEIPVLNNDAVNKKYVDDSLAIYLNGVVSSHALSPNSLFAFGKPTSRSNAMYITPFTYGLPNVVNEHLYPVTDYSFPIGCKIYYNPNYLATPNVEVVGAKFYSSYKEVHPGANAIYTSVPLQAGANSAVFLRVSVVGNSWYVYSDGDNVAEILVTSNDLVKDNYYIYLGRTNNFDTVEGRSYTFQLEDNNPLYYYDGYNLIDWASYIAEDSVAGTVQSITVGTTTTGEPGTNANVVNSGTPTNQILDFYIPRGADAVNPFKGWFASDTQLMAEYPNPSNGDYAYVQTQNGVLVYQASGGAWRGTTIVFNPSNNQEFASGESLNLVSIINDLVTGGASNVLSAQQGVVLNTLISNLQTLVNNLSQQMPVLEKKTAQEIQILIDTGTWTQGTLYYSVEED